MALTVTEDRARVERISRNFCILTGSIAFDSSYVTGGMDLADISKYFTTMKSIIFEGEAGYLFEFDKANDTVVVYVPSDLTAATEAAHTHGVLLDGGVSGAEAAHTHAVALDSGASAVPDGTNVVADGQSRSPSLYQKLDNPVDLVTALTEVTWTTCTITDFVVIPSGSDAVLLRIGLNDDTAGSYIAVRDPDVGSGRGEVGWCTAEVANVTHWVDIIQSVPKTGANGQKFEYAVADNGGGGPISDTAHIAILGYWRKLTTLPDASHTHASGTLADAASAGGSSHTHGSGSLADAASAVGSSHTHGPGSLADAASAVGSAHTHTMTSAAGSEVGSGDDLSGITALQFIAVGLKD